MADTKMLVNRAIIATVTNSSIKVKAPAVRRGPLEESPLQEFFDKRRTQQSPNVESRYCCYVLNPDDYFSAGQPHRGLSDYLNHGRPPH